MELTLGEKIRTLRKGKMTQPELAEKIGVHEMTVSRWELGKRKPSINEIQKLAAVLGVPVTELLSDSPAELPPMPAPVPELKTSRTALVYERNGERMELPPTEESYKIFREIALRMSAPAAVN